MGLLRSSLGTFVLGFAACALVARFVLPSPAGAVSPVAFRTVDPADVVARVGRSVVSLETYPGGSPPRAVDPLPRLLGLPGREEPDPDAVASGVILSRRGYIVTNAHVIEDAGRVRARLADGREFNAAIIGKDAHTDLAIVKIDGRGLTAAQLGESRHVRPGDPVVAIGNPLGFENSVSVGVVSANRSGPFRVDGRTLGDMIQTDAAINQGNSGGGLFSADGRLLGINTAIMVTRGASGSIGIGFAIPAHRLHPVVDQIIAQGRVPRPWLGIKYPAPRSSILVRHVRHGAGVLIQEVIPGGPAARAGLEPGDLLRQLGNCRIRSADDLYVFVTSYRPGQRVQARVLRAGREKVLTLTPGDLNS